MSCGDSIRVVQPLFPVGEQGSPPLSPLLFDIIEINPRVAVQLNRLWHSKLPIYNTGFCLNSTISFGAIYKNVYFAAAIWTNPVAQALPQRTWLELRRLAICDDAPKNTASRMLSVMSKTIRRQFKHIHKLISYQDVETHSGTIYKASGWGIGAYHKGGSWDRPNAKNSWNGAPRTRPNLNGAVGPKIRWEKQIRPEPKEIKKSVKTTETQQQLFATDTKC